jgi:hypothetical protein
VTGLTKSGLLKGILICTGRLELVKQYN